MEELENNECAKPHSLLYLELKIIQKC